MARQNMATAQLPSNRFGLKIKTYLLDYKRSLIFVIPLFLVTAGIIFQVSASKARLERDVVELQKLYEKWSDTETLDTTVLQSLKKIMDKHPELAAPYESRILQQWLVKGDHEKSPAYIQNLLKKASHLDANFYHDFSKVTILMSQKEFEKALAHSIQLKDSMMADKPFWELSKSSHIGSYLFACNLLRISMLCQHLGKAQEELRALGELKQYAKWDGIDNGNLPVALHPAAMEQLSQHFKDQQMTLKDYVKHREQVLLQAAHSN